MEMRRKSILYAVICMNIMVVFVISAQARSLEEIKKTKEIRICISPHHPSIVTTEPKGCREDCKVRGPVYEEIMAFVATLDKDIKPRFLRVKWDEMFFDKKGKTVRDASYTPELLASGQCDIYPSNLSKLEWRLKKLDFVILFPNRMMVIVHKSKKELFKTPDDLAGKLATVEKDTSFHTYLQHLNKTIFKDNPIQIRLMLGEDALNSVDMGKADFTILDSDNAIWSVRHQTKNSVVAFPVGPTDEIGWAFRKTDKDLQEVVRQFFDKQRASEDSELNRMWEKYFGISLTRFIMLMGSVK